MSLMPLVHKNSSRPDAPPPASWLQTPARQFFSSFNWDDHPPQVQKLQQTLLASRDLDADAGPMIAPSLTLSVSQFFAVTPWDGALGPALIPPSADNSMAESTSDFTLDNFSNLF